MGLAISYDFNLNCASVSQAREKVVALHRYASALPFVQVGELIELEGSDCLLKHQDLQIALKICALSEEEIANNLLNNTSETKCRHLIGFSTLPGRGCSEATFGLATPVAMGDNRNWKWRTFCKTQYASNPEYGGIENFLKCHLLVVRMLEAAKQLGILGNVSDPSGYWEERNLEALVETITKETVMMAAIMGNLKDAFEQQGYKAIAPILDYPNFEYLEAEGNNK